MKMWNDFRQLDCVAPSTPGSSEYGLYWPVVFMYSPARVIMACSGVPPFAVKASTQDMKLARCVLSNERIRFALLWPPNLHLLA